MMDEQYLQELVDGRLDAVYPYVANHIETSAKVYPSRAELWRWSCEYAKYLTAVHKKVGARDVHRCAVVWHKLRDKVVQADYDAYFEAQRAVVSGDNNPEPCPECGADLETRVTSGFDDEMVIETYCTECAYSTVDIG